MLEKSGKVKGTKYLTCLVRLFCLSDSPHTLRKQLQNRFHSNVEKKNTETQYHTLPDVLWQQIYDRDNTSIVIVVHGIRTLYPRMPYRNTCAHRRCLSLQSATMTSRFPNTVMMMMMERKMVRTTVSSELRNSCCCCWSCCCSVFITSSNKL